MSASQSGYVKFKDVSKVFGTVVALEKISFEVDKGEFVFITGHSGAGKTTILKLMLGELRPDSGNITVGGVDVDEISSSQIPLYRQGIGTVFQDFKVLMDRTVRENVEVALAVIGLPQSDWDSRVKNILKLVGLVNQANLFPNQLSGGELQRTSLARALIVNPQILLADEPTGNLDWETADSIMQIFEKIHKEGKTIIMATHNEEIIKKYKKRVIHLDGGKIDHDKH